MPKDVVKYFAPKLALAFSEALCAISTSLAKAVASTFLTSLLIFDSTAPEEVFLIFSFLTLSLSRCIFSRPS